MGFQVPGGRIVFAFLAFAAPVGVASAAAPAPTAELKAVYDTYLAGLKGEDPEKLFGAYTKSAFAKIKEDMKSPDDAAMFMMIHLSVAPESYEVKHAAFSKDAQRARLFLLLHLAADPDFDRPKKKDFELEVELAREGGKWGITSFTQRGDPAKVKRPKRTDYDPKNSRTSADGSVGGRVVRVEEKADHTLVMVRVLDEELAVFLPPKATLVKAGFPWEELVPWAFCAFEGHPHAKDPAKFFATGGGPEDEQFD